MVFSNIAGELTKEFGVNLRRCHDDVGDQVSCRLAGVLLRVSKTVDEAKSTTRLEDKAKFLADTLSKVKPEIGKPEIGAWSRTRRDIIGDGCVVGAG
jgi:hypothetical protein